MLRTYLGLSDKQVAEAMSISTPGRSGATWPGACHRSSARPGRNNPGNSVVRTLDQPARRLDSGERVVCAPLRQGKGVEASISPIPKQSMALADTKMPEVGCPVDI